MDLMRKKFALLVLTALVLSLFAGSLLPVAGARVDFAQWANRSTRVLEPADYNVNGTCAGQICNWKGVQGIGNVGIGNGSTSCITDNTTKDETLYPEYVLQGVVSTNDNDGKDADPAGKSASTGTESSANISDSIKGITYGKPYPGILNEYPVEAAAVYGKLAGLRMPDGRTIDVGIKSIGYEY